jgi:hypothetical protein
MTFRSEHYPIPSIMREPSVCCCRKSMRIDGIDYEYNGPSDAACPVHGVRSRYVERAMATLSDKRADTKRHASHQPREDS